MPYALAEDVRAVLGLSAAVLPDLEAARLLDFATDRIDGLIGDREVNTTSGRKITEADVEGWRWAKLATATARLAARFYEEPDLIWDRRWESMSGEVSVSGPLGSVLGAAVMDPLRDSGLLPRPSGSARLRRYDDQPTH